MTLGPHAAVDASPSWVTHRLEALAQTLLLPAPVRDGFLFRPDAAFYAACTDSIITIQSAARRIIEHLGLQCDTVIVAFRTLPHPGHIQRAGRDWHVEIASKHRDDARAIGAILAHECCHMLVEDRKLPRFGTSVDEVHVDLAAMLSGLGALTLNGISDDETRAFGYLSAPLLVHAYATVATALGIDRDRATRDLAASTHRRVTWQLRTRLRRAALAYRVLEGHTIIPCRSQACPKRLRVPTGAIGTARCPSCGTADEFDGRACSFRPLAVPAPMYTAEAPRRPNLLARITLPMRIAIVAVAVVVTAYAIGSCRSEPPRHERRMM
ncbi:MAG: hypothetical protein ABI867_20310 [Kofleriaceae bacterium]